MIQRQILRWAQFAPIATPLPGQMRARNGAPIVAAVNIAINFDPLSPATSVGRLQRFDPPHVTVTLWTANFVPSRLPASQRDYYLRHEQGHMDLMTLHARELEVKIAHLQSAQLYTDVRTIVNQTVADAHNIAINSPSGDCRHDLETNHGMNRGEQQRWLRHIDSELRRMGDANYEFRSPD